VPTFRELVFGLVAQLPRGRVSSYGRLASALGQRGQSRQVGWALSSIPPGLPLPAHRVVRVDGRMAGGSAFGSPDVQRGLLEAEGVRFLKDGRVDLSRHLWPQEQLEAAARRVRRQRAGPVPGAR
jgi:methylated-DNA-protein-cysteine methyltransferase-like protein